MGGFGTPVEVAVRFVEAFGKRDLAAVEGLLAGDVVFESPRVRLVGAEPVLAAIGQFAGIVDGVDILAAFGDERRAVVVYDMHTGPFGTLRTVDYLVVEDGRVRSDSVVFDTHPVREAERAAQ